MVAIKANPQGKYGRCALFSIYLKDEDRTYPDFDTQLYKELEGKTGKPYFVVFEDGRVCSFYNRKTKESQGK